MIQRTLNGMYMVSDLKNIHLNIHPCSLQQKSHSEVGTSNEVWGIREKG